MNRVGILTPMANPTVEAEMRLLLPPSVDFVTARLVSDSAEPKQRLIDYAEEARSTSMRFGGMRLDAIGFACTGSSYLIGADRQSRLARDFSLPFVFAAAAIAAQIERRKASRIAVISPYPIPLHRAGLDFWRSLGFDIIYEARVEIGSSDTMAIYALTGTEAAPLVTEARAHRPDLILLSGTGMPTLGLIDPDAPIPIVSSNYSLAQALISLACAGTD